MTNWMDWRCWTHFIIGRDRATAGLVLELDFANRRVTYLRETGNSYSECPHPFGTEEYERYFHDTIEARFDHVWVDPSKRPFPGKDESESLSALEKPSSFIELIDVDPRDYFGEEPKLPSTCGDSQEEACIPSRDPGVALPGPGMDDSTLKRSEMYARAFRLRHADTNPTDRELDRQAILEWFFRNESMAPSQAATCPRDQCKQSVEERKSQARIRRMLGVFEMLDEWGEPLPDRIREWLALMPHLR